MVGGVTRTQGVDLMENKTALFGHFQGNFKLWIEARGKENYFAYEE